MQGVSGNFSRFRLIPGVSPGKEIKAVLIHADSLGAGVLGERPVQGARDPQPELSGIAALSLRLGNIVPVLNRGGQPLALAVLGVLQRPLASVSPQVMQPGSSG